MPKEIKTLNGLRGVLALLVVLYHSGVFNGRVVWCAVSLFFMLSGFVVRYRYGSARFNCVERRAFLLRRVARIYPLHLLTLLIVLLTTGFALSKALVLNALLLQCYVPIAGVNMSYNVPSWFLCDILFCYVCYLPVSGAVRRLGLGKRVLALLLLMLALAVLVTAMGNKYYSYFFPPSRFVEFFGGMVACDVCFAPSEARAASHAGRLRARLLPFLRRPVAATAAAGLLLVVLGLTFLEPDERQLPLHGLVWILPGLLLLASLALSSGACLSRTLASPPLAFLGGISLEIYLLQQLVITLFPKELFVPLGAWGAAARVALIVATLTLAAWATGRAFTQPVAHWLMRRKTTRG